MNFEVDVKDLRGASAAVRSAAEQARGLRLGEALLPLTRAMPGGHTVKVVQDVALDWDSNVTKWVSDAERLSGALDEAANRYRECDEQSARAVSALPRHEGGAG